MNCVLYLCCWRSALSTTSFTSTSNVATTFHSFQFTFSVSCDRKKIGTENSFSFSRSVKWTEKWPHRSARSDCHLFCIVFFMSFLLCAKLLPLFNPKKNEIYSSGKQLRCGGAQTNSHLLKKKKVKNQKMNEQKKKCVLKPEHWKHDRTKTLQRKKAEKNWR